MTQEDMSWFYEGNVLVGHAEKHRPWWAPADMQTTRTDKTSPLYVGPVPVEEVKRRIFDWEPMELPVAGLQRLEDGRIELHEHPTLKAIHRSDTMAPLSIVGSKYNPHEFKQTLIGGAQALTDSEIQINSAGLLSGGAVGWVQISFPDHMEFSGGVQAKPFVIMATSLDRSMKTITKALMQNVVCDNTLTVGLEEFGDIYSVLHSKNGEFNPSAARDKIHVVFKEASEAFGAEVERLLSKRVNDRQFEKFINMYIPVPEKAGKGKTQAYNRQDELRNMWEHDPRVAPWTKTAWGLYQLGNTYMTHMSIVRKTESSEENRFARNLYSSLRDSQSGSLAKLDKILLHTINKATAR